MPRKNIARDLIYAYLIILILRSAPRFRKKSSIRKYPEVLLSQTKRPRVLKDALFLVTLPLVYGALRRRYPNSVAPVLFSVPLFQLIEPSLQRTCAIYAATTALGNIGRRSKLREILPPTWTLIFPANSWLLWAFLFRGDCAPRSYIELILRHSGYGSEEPTESLLQFLRESKFERLQVSKPSKESPCVNSTYAVCARLHPLTSSCLETYIRAWLIEFPRVWRWVGGFGALTLILSRRGRLLDSPRKVLWDWIVSTIRGTAFVIGTINTCWGLTCLLQRLLKPGSLQHTRWIMNGMIGNLWILVLPSKRRADLALYSTRLAIGSLWELMRIPTEIGASMIIAMAWASLLRDQRNGMRPPGLSGLILEYVNRHCK